MTQQDYNFGGVNSFNSTSYVSQLENYIPSYQTYDNFSYEYPRTQIKNSSSSYFQEQVMQLSEEDLFLALKYEMEANIER